MKIFKRNSIGSLGVIYAGKAKHEGYDGMGKYIAIGIVDILLWSSIIGFIILAIAVGADW